MIYSTDRRYRGKVGWIPLDVRPHASCSQSLHLASPSGIPAKSHFKVAEHTDATVLLPTSSLSFVQSFDLATGDLGTHAVSRPSHSFMV